MIMLPALLDKDVWFHCVNIHAAFTMDINGTHACYVYNVYTYTIHGITSMALKVSV